MSILFVQVEDVSLGSLRSPQEENTQSGKQWEWGLSLHFTLTEVAPAHLSTLMFLLVCVLCVLSSTVSVRFGLRVFEVCEQNSGTN